MELNINIETGEKCSFLLSDTKQGYLEESYELSLDFSKFKYSETKSLIGLGLVTSKNDNILYNVTFMEHDKQDIEIPTKFDGRFLIQYIVLPTKLWFLKNQDNLSNYLSVYYIDGEIIYKYFKKESTVVDINEVIEINPENTTISKAVINCVSICFLKRCFISICRLIFEQLAFTKCQTDGKVDPNLIYRRDLVWMFINTISYLVEFGLLDEALRLIELINDCNGICKQEYRELDTNGCGCS